MPTDIVYTNNIIYVYNFYLIIYIYIWTHYSDLTGIMVNKGNHPQMALIQISEIL